MFLDQSPIIRRDDTAVIRVKGGLRDRHEIELKLGKAPPIVGPQKQQEVMRGRSFECHNILTHSCRLG